MKTTLQQQLIILFSMIANRNPSTSVTEMPQHIITEEEALAMRQCFHDNQYKYINTGLRNSFPQAASDKSHVTFDLEDLKKFIALAEATATQQQYSNLGIRIYKAAKLNENGIPVSTVFMRAVGAPNEAKLSQPIAFDQLAPIPQSAYYNKGHVGGNGSGNQ